MGAAGLAAIPHRCCGSMVVAGPKKFGKERAGAYAQTRHSGAPLCLLVQDWARNQVGAPGEGAGW